MLGIEEIHLKQISRSGKCGGDHVIGQLLRKDQKSKNWSTIGKPVKSGRVTPSNDRERSI